MNQKVFQGPSVQVQIEDAVDSTSEIKVQNGLTILKTSVERSLLFIKVVTAYWSSIANLSIIWGPHMQAWLGD